MIGTWLRSSLWPLAASGSLLLGCSFSSDTPFLDDDGGADLPADADLDTPDADPAAPDAALADAAPIDAAPVPDAEPGTPDATPCEFDDQDICDTGDPDDALVLDANRTIDTDNDPLCRALAQVGGPEVCLIVLDGLTLNAGVILTGEGSKPLVIASVGDINLNGLVDVSSRISGQVGAGANFGDCTVATIPEPDVGGSGGGAGGSFAGAGGNGGSGDQDESSGDDGDGAGGTADPAASQPTFLRGGCPGGEGAERNDTNLTPGGDGGGAIMLLTPANINLNAGSAIRATGAGGQGGEGDDHAGGGGGGTGGHIILEATNINLGGNVGANGGGGGEGGVRFGVNNPDGGDGADGALSATGANGGSGGSQFGGNGGDGSSQANLNGETGGSDDGAGGGGGGGAGFIVFRGTVNDNGGQVSPPAIVE